MEQSSVEVYTPHLKKVLKSYQAAAAASLHGPNNFMAATTTQEATSPTEKMGIVTATGEDKSGPSITTSIPTPEKKTSSSDYKSASDYDPFLAPPPFPIQQPPIIIPPDQSRCERSETLLEGETISCFVVGGEKRLCFPQVLNPVLRDFSLPQIYSVFSELNIHFSSCNQEQLEILKVTGVLPLTAPSCGLITKSDAERLCAALFHNREAIPKSETRSCDKLLFNFKVYHECFGKCTGILTPELYTTPYSRCIECVECHGMLSTQKFVTHVHRFSENRTCHWGVDSENWRAYLLLSENQDNIVQLNEHLEDVKNRFNFSQKHKRKQSVAEESDVSKRLHLEEQPFFYPYSSVTWDPALAYWYHITAFPWSRMPAFRPWAAVPTESGKSHFVSSSLSSHLPYLRDGIAASLPSFLAQSPERIAQASIPYRLQNHHVSSMITNFLSSQEEIKTESKDKKVKEEDLEDACDLSVFNSPERKSAETPQAIHKEKEQLTETEETVSQSSSSTLSADTDIMGASPGVEHEAKECTEVLKDLEKLSGLLQSHRITESVSSKIVEEVEAMLSSYWRQLVESVNQCKALQKELEHTFTSKRKKLCQVYNDKKALERELKELKLHQNGCKMSTFEVTKNKDGAYLALLTENRALKQQIYLLQEEIAQLKDSSVPKQPHI